MITFVAESSGGNICPRNPFCKRRALFLLMQNRVPDVWPELFYDVECCVKSKFLPPPLAGLGPSTILVGVIEPSDSRRGAIADHLREIRLRTAAVRPRNYQTAEGVSATLEEAAVAQRKVSWVFFENNREGELGKEIAQGLVGEVVVIILSECVCPIAKLRDVPFRHADSAEKAHINESGVVETVLEEYLEIEQGK